MRSDKKEKYNNERTLKAMCIYENYASMLNAASQKRKLSHIQQKAPN
jgi:hypothetical protein